MTKPKRRYSLVCTAETWRAFVLGAGVREMTQGAYLALLCETIAALDPVTVTA